MKNKVQHFLEATGKRILIVKQSSLGDIIHTLPVAHALKRCAPSCQIGWVVERAFAPLLACDPAVDNVYPIHIPSTSSPDAEKEVYAKAFAAMLKTLRVLRRIFRQEPYDLVLDLHASFKSGLIGLMNPSGTRIGFAGSREMNAWFQHQHIHVEPYIEHALEKNMLFGAFLGCPVREEDFYLCVGREDEERAEAFLRDAGVVSARPFAYVNPAARWQSKFWLPERWSGLCDRLVSSGIQVIFGGSPGERAAIEDIIRKMSGRAAIAAGTLSLTGSAALMRRAAIYIGLDTGPMHMAAMAGIPVVALFGPTHPERVGPYGVPHAVVRAERLDCLCCRKRTCEHMRCMRGISVDMVYAAVAALLGEKSGAGWHLSAQE